MKITKYDIIKASLIINYPAASRWGIEKYNKIDQKFPYQSQDSVYLRRNKK
jgi:hypothetical protein